jgi:DNA-directed RNA polymerase subunit RPC12/RpoP
MRISVIGPVAGAEIQDIERLLRVACSECKDKILEHMSVRMAKILKNMLNKLKLSPSEDCSAQPTFSASSVPPLSGWVMDRKIRLSLSFTTQA